jgi:hypothetical protein
MDWKGWINSFAPDLIPLDLFPLELCKDQVFRAKITSSNQFRERIINVIGSVTSQMLENIEHETEYRLDLLSATDGIRVKMC